jgi:hypothetical protein
MEYKSLHTFLIFTNREKVPDGVWELVRDLILIGKDSKSPFLSGIGNRDLN